MGTTLIRNGDVVDVESQPHVLSATDVLVDGATIAEVGPGLNAGADEVIDASGRLVLPGFVDTHRHTWTTALRGMVPDGTLGGYFDQVLTAFGPRYRPDDVYAGTLVGALECLDSGITTLFDWSHSVRTPDHADAAVAGLRDSGVRAVFGYGRPADAASAGPLPADDVRRVRTTHLADDDALVTMALSASGPAFGAPDDCAHDWALARDLGVRISVHLMADSHVEALHERGLLGPDTTYVHCVELGERGIGLIAGSGGSVSLAPAVEANLAMGSPPTAQLLRSNIATGLSADTVTSGPGDMFGIMRATLALERTKAGEITAPDVLRMATLDGAAALGMADRVGSLRPGKRADIVLLRTDTPGTSRAYDPIGAVVIGADTNAVDTVLVAGQPAKRDGRLVHSDVHRALDLLHASARDLRG